MKAVTLLLGEHFEKMAAMTVPMFEQSTGLVADVIRLPSGADPFREKLRLTERLTDGFVFFDLDCLFLQPWAIVTPALLTLAKGIVWRGCTWDSDGNTRVYNTGVMLVPPGCAPLFARALDIYDSGTSNCFDEGPLLTAIHELDWPVVEMPERFNFQDKARAPAGTVVWHLAGGGTAPEWKLRLVTNAVDRAKRGATQEIGFA
jgi:hypothetical protein